MLHFKQSGRYFAETASSIRHQTSGFLASVFLASGLLASVAPQIGTAQETVLGVTPRFHLDASQLNQLREKSGLAILKDGDPVDKWLDATESHADFISVSSEGRPRLISGDGYSSIRFDGVDDAMRFTWPMAAMTKGSIWIVVAPHANPGDFRGLFATNAPNERDYTSGINFDLGPGPTLRWDMFNVEGRGF
ncbi:MAG: hypothetical protein FJ308_24010, partial [Planctomycetes bacterium]|nr:hypothetical protein [Planctomycetota bacterium]